MSEPTTTLTATPFEPGVQTVADAAGRLLHSARARPAGNVAAARAV